MRLIVILSLLGASPALAVTKKLNVTLIPQETNSWCWAASAQMVMSYLGGTTISQCDQVNYRCDNPYNDDWEDYNCGNVDCCQSDTPSKCIHPGSVSEDLEHWFFSFDLADGAVSWQHLKDEIDAGRPVIWAQKFPDDGGHVLVAAGYREKDDGTKKVWVLDPWEPNVGDAYWLSYADYIVVFGHYTHQDDLWHIEDEKQCYTSFHEELSVDMQDCFDYQVQRGRYLDTLSANHASALFDTYQGAWRTGSNNPYVHWGLTSGEYQFYFNTYDTLGYRPKQVTATYGTSGDVQYTAIFISTDKGFTSSHRQSLADFQADADDPPFGYSLYDFSVYDDDGTTLVIATWVDNPTPYRVRYGMTSAGFETLFDTFETEGFQIHRFNAYDTANGVRYAALWHPANGVWAMHYGMTASEYQTQTSLKLDNGYDLVNITALDNIYAATWEK